MTLWLLAWPPVTLFVHILVHEGAHWAVVRAIGLHHVWLYPYPHRHEGRWHWGRTAWRGPPLTDAQEVAVSTAPLVAELAWAVLALTAALWWPWAALEAVTSLVDILVGWGLLRRAEGSDARRMVELLR